MRGASMEPTVWPIAPGEPWAWTNGRIAGWLMAGILPARRLRGQRAVTYDSGALAARDAAAGRGEASMAAAYDLGIRGGTIYDGTGGPGARADVGVRAERIAAIGPIAERGGSELDAT